MEQRQISMKIDRAIRKEKQYNRRQVKLLLLGAGESGKSTVLKQMKIIHGLKFEREDLSEYQSIVYQNIIRGMRVLVDAREKLAIPWQNNTNSAHAPGLLRIDSAMLFDTKVFLEYATGVKALWTDAAIQQAYERRREFQLVSDNINKHLELVGFVYFWLGKQQCDSPVDRLEPTDRSNI